RSTTTQQTSPGRSCASTPTCTAACGSSSSPTENRTRPRAPCTCPSRVEGKVMTTQPHRTPSDPPRAHPREASDVELLRAVAEGDEAAFVELRGRYGRGVARVCQMVGRRDREDCEQEVFVRIWRKAALFDETRGSAAAWLLTLARRTAL